MQAEPIDIPRVLIAALRGGSGKTVVSIGLIAALADLGKTIAPFKKGPDYIDAGWLAMAAARPCHNLDSFLFSESTVCHSFIHHSRSADISVVEGNRGLYDGLDVSGTTSTAALARLIAAPVILCLDCTKSTRTMAAVVLGCLHFDPDVHIAGVVLNRVAGSRHERILRTSIESHCGVSVVGSIPKLSSQDFPERHMGLTPTPEHVRASDSIAAATRVAQSYLDLTAISQIAEKAAQTP
ncbi:MAG: AAA family ATPase, partial [Thermodesulfobacteriota bacterium]